MDTLINQINLEIENAFEKAGYDKEKAKCEISKKLNFGDYQINSALSIAKQNHKNPIEVANEIASNLQNDLIFQKVEVCPPGFINLTLSDNFLLNYLHSMYKTIEKNNNSTSEDTYLGINFEKEPKRVVVDYGGANVAKPLHIGHLRSAVIGECIKRLLKRKGNVVVADVHLGDFGLQMGLTICELIEEGKEKNFTITDLEKAYPLASKKAKELNEDGSLKNPEFAKKAHEITKALQEEREPYFSIWKKIVDVSIKDLKKNYDALDVHFDLWNGEACANKYIPELISILLDKKIAHESDGALVVDVKDDNDKNEIPPCLIRKSDGAVLYATTDLATIIDRERNIKPDEYIYITDIRQAMHFLQVFRVAKKAGLVKDNTKLIHIGFGTMNGKDGLALKTRDGGVIRLETLCEDVRNAAREKIKLNKFDNTEKHNDEEINSNKSIDSNTIEDISNKVALAALKYGDLSNICQKDYVFDIEKFVSFDGNTGPYILYTIVRINSILSKLSSNGYDIDNLVFEKINDIDQVTKNLELQIARYPEEFENVYKELAPHKMCAYIFSLANAYNSFYHEHNIIREENDDKKKLYIELSILTKKILEDAIKVLGFEAPIMM